MRQSSRNNFQSLEEVGEARLNASQKYPSPRGVSTGVRALGSAFLINVDLKFILARGPIYISTRRCEVPRK